MKKRIKAHVALVTEKQANRAYKRRTDQELQEFHNRIVVSKFWPSAFESPTGWHYHGVLARGKEYRQLRRVDPHFMTYVGRVKR